MGLGPASEPLLAAAGSVPSKGSELCLREVYLFLSPRPSFSSPLTRPPWPTGEPRGYEGSCAHGFVASERRFLSGGPNSF